VVYLKEKGKFTVPVEKTIEKFLKDFVDIYGTNNWACSTYATNTGMIRNYINPHIGKVKLKNVTTKSMDTFFSMLSTLPRVPLAGRPDTGMVSNKQVKEIHVLLTTAFNKAVEWGEIGKNPITKSSRPVVKKKIVKVLDASQTKYLISKCEDLRLLTCIFLAIGCSMRVGEILGLRWENVNFGDLDNDFEDAQVRVIEELQRVTLDSLTHLKSRLEDIRFTFPVIKKHHQRDSS
jgi:integrase